MMDTVIKWIENTFAVEGEMLGNFWFAYPIAHGYRVRCGPEFMFIIVDAYDAMKGVGNDEYEMKLLYSDPNLFAKIREALE